MSVLQIHDLLEPADLATSQKRALDILNWRHNDPRDTSTLVAAVDDARVQHDSFWTVLAASKQSTDELISTTRFTASEHLHTAQELSLLRHSLADELSTITSELVSSMSDGQPTLLEDIEVMHRNLKELESIKTYVHVIERALSMSEAAIAEIQDSNPITVSLYRSLRMFVSSVITACSQVSDVTGQPSSDLRLVSFLEELQDRTWLAMKSTLSALLLAVMERLHWPMPIDFSSAIEDDKRAFSKAFSDLIKLQVLGEQIHSSQESSEKDVLYPIQALVQPVSLRFKYHFEGSRQTNKLDKPEWYFTHVLNVSHEHRPFMEDVVQQLLSATQYRDVNAWAEFTHALLPLLSRRLKRTISSLLSHPPLLAHTIYQALSFDAALKEEGFSLAGTMVGRNAGVKSWDGISEVVLGRKEWFDRWVEGERAFALDQYHDIIGSPEAWLIVDDDAHSEENRVATRELRPTNSARRLKALVEQVTDRYTPIPQFSQRARFLINVQLPLLELYHGRIGSSLDAFETLSSALVRAVPGALTSDGREKGRLTSGVEGVMRLCKALVSAKWISAAMVGWGEDLFFLELWTEINRRAALRVRAETHPSLPDPKDSSNETPDGTIFEELVTQYEKLVARAEDMIVQQICGEVEGALKVHLLNQGTPNSSPDLSVSTIAISPALLPALSILSSHLSVLSRTLPHSITIALYRNIATNLSTHILQRNILYRGHHRLAPAEGKILHGECELWVETCRQALGSISVGPRGRVEAPWRRLLEAGRVVGAEGERWDAIVAASFGTLSDDEWGARMTDLVDETELSRDEVCMIAKTRTDCDC